MASRVDQVWFNGYCIFISYTALKMSVYEYSKIPFNLGVLCGNFLFMHLSSSYTYVHYVPFRGELERYLGSSSLDPNCLFPASGRQ